MEGGKGMEGPGAYLQMDWIEGDGREMGGREGDEGETDGKWKGGEIHSEKTC
jgi:hypothetical protein